MSHNTEESENSPNSPHLKRMRKQGVPGAPPFFVHAGDEAKLYVVLSYRGCFLRTVSDYPCHNDVFNGKRKKSFPGGEDTLVSWLLYNPLGQKSA